MLRNQCKLPVYATISRDYLREHQEIPLRTIVVEGEDQIYNKRSDELLSRDIELIISSSWC
jgi:hypothetical protein